MMTLTRNDPQRSAERPPSGAVHRPSRLAVFLLIGYGLLIVTGSLYPFSGWRWPVDPVLSYLAAPWPRYLLRWEIPLNVAGYIPFGALVILGLRSARSTSVAIAGATLAGALLSLVLESLQVFIPGRIASNLDVASNTLGALAGGVLAQSANRVWSLRARFRLWRHSTFATGVYSDLATALLLAWLFAQINPVLGFFGTVAPGALAQAPAAAPDSAMRQLLFESLLTGMNTLYLLVLLRMLTGATRASLIALAVLAAGSAMLKSLGGVLLLKEAEPWAWATPGALAGIAAGVLLFGVWSRRGATGALWLGGITLTGVLCAAFALPWSTYQTVALQPVTHGHFANLAGATWWAAQLWPWFVLVCLAGLKSQVPPRSHAHP